MFSFTMKSTIFALLLIATLTFCLSLPLEGPSARPKRTLHHLFEHHYPNEIPSYPPRCPGVRCPRLPRPAPAPEGMEWTASYGSYPLNYYRSYPLAYRYYTAPLTAPLVSRIAAPLTARIATPIVAPLTVDTIKSYEADDFASMYGFYPSAK
ncbi:unnamed protein product [Plutella xylostella]|uniref:(diamondback moth) hypothetical protein n=1 Tax=Plutella xylostella TaxID=51655 RepID=A0A8S4G6C1_PLUXY|nr:unnamed protein product [Plutella xylostella]